MAISSIKKDFGKVKEKTQPLEKMDSSRRPFSKVNFMMMAGCLLLIIVGFILMSGGGSGDNSFSPEVFSTRRIVVGPLLSFLGFLLMAFAIIRNPAPKKNRKDN